MRFGSCSTVPELPAPSTLPARLLFAYRAILPAPGAVNKAPVCAARRAGQCPLGYEPSRLPRGDSGTKSGTLTVA
jgi:hypothetical protein